MKKSPFLCFRTCLQLYRRDFQGTCSNVAEYYVGDIAAMSPSRYHCYVAMATRLRYHAVMSPLYREVQQFRVAFVSQLYRRDFRQCRGDIAAT